MSVEDECNWGAMVCIMWAANSYWVFRKYGGKNKPSGNPARFCVIDFTPITASVFLFISYLWLCYYMHKWALAMQLLLATATWLHAQRKAEANGGSEMVVSGGKMGMFLADRWSTLGVGPGSSWKTSNNVCLTEGRPLLTSFPSLFILTYLSFIHVSTYTLGQHPKKYLPWAK